jgi:hypothetical protein
MGVEKKEGNDGFEFLCLAGGVTFPRLIVWLCLTVSQIYVDIVGADWIRSMSDPRFARIRSDPRFRRPRKLQSKVVVDDRFKEIFDEKSGKGKRVKSGPYY